MELNTPAQLAWQGIESILSPQQQRRPLPSLLYKFFFYDRNTSLNLFGIQYMVENSKNVKVHLQYTVGFCISSQTTLLFSASVRKLLCCFLHQFANYVVFAPVRKLLCCFLHQFANYYVVLCRGRRRLAMQNVVPSYTSAPNRFRVNKEPVFRVRCCMRFL